MFLQSQTPYDLQLHQIELEAQNEEFREGIYRSESLLANMKYQKLVFEEYFNLAPFAFLICKQDATIVKLNRMASNLLNLQVPTGQRLTVYITDDYKSMFHRFIDILFSISFTPNLFAVLEVEDILHNVCIKATLDSKSQFALVSIDEKYMIQG